MLSRGLIGDKTRGPTWIEHAQMSDQRLQAQALTCRANHRIGFKGLPVHEMDGVRAERFDDWDYSESPGFQRGHETVIDGERHAVFRLPGDGTLGRCRNPIGTQIANEQTTDECGIRVLNPSGQAAGPNQHWMRVKAQQELRDDRRPMPYGHPHLLRRDPS